MKEQDFHRLIEQQEQESKKRVWERIESQIEKEPEEVVINSDSTLALAKSRIFNRKNIIILSAAFLFLILIVILPFILLQKNEEPKNNFRYCNEDDYYIEALDTNLAQYAEQNNMDILYFNWYDQIEYWVDTQYKLNTTNEVVGLREKLEDINGYYLYFYITDDKTQLDFLNEFTDICVESIIINSVEVKWNFDGMDGHAMFSYNGYNYYLKAQEVFEQNYVLDLVESLLA